jgi:hypothetical protein
MILSLHLGCEDMVLLSNDRKGCGDGGIVASVLRPL